MCNKAVESGFRIWAFCDSGYMFHAFQHSYSQPRRDCGAFRRQISHSSAIVAHICEELPRRSQGRSKRITYSMYMESLFSSIKLFVVLRNLEIGALRLFEQTLAAFQKHLHEEESATTNWTETRLSLLYVGTGR